MKHITLLFAALVLFVGSAMAQNGVFAPYATVGVGATGGAFDLNSKKNPNFTVGGGVESSTKHLLLDIHATYNSADNIVVSNGYTVGVNGAGYLKVFNHFLAGVGADYTVNNIDVHNLSGVLTTVKSTYQAAHPFVGGGFETKRFRVLANYELPGKNGLVNERITNANLEIFAAKHLRVTTGTQFNSYVSPTTGGRNLSIGASAGIKLVL